MRTCMHPRGLQRGQAERPPVCLPVQTTSPCTVTVNARCWMCVSLGGPWQPEEETGRSWGPVCLCVCACVHVRMSVCRHLDGESARALLIGVLVELVIAALMTCCQRRALQRGVVVVGQEELCVVRPLSVGKVQHAQRTHARV